MARPSNEQKQARARQSLIKTIAKIYDLEPTLGRNWRANMLSYYIDRLAELVLYQLGFENVAERAIQALADEIRDVLEVGPREI